MHTGRGADASRTREEEGDHNYLMQRQLDPNLPSFSGSHTGGASPTGGGAPATRSAILREELSAEGRAIMEACENDETWQTSKRMRGNGKDKFLTCLCVMIQEVVEDLDCAARFRGWAERWGEDELDACVLHEHAYALFQRHVMGITAAQFVWEPLEDEHAGGEQFQQSASSSTAGAPMATGETPTANRKRVSRKTPPGSTRQGHE